MSWGRFGRKGPGSMNERMGSKRTTCAQGHSHRSKLEGAVCQLLHLRQKAGEIEVLQAEDHVYLTDAKIACVPDFRCRYTATGQEFWVEAKGFANDRWPIIKKLWGVYGPGPLEIWKGTHTNPKLAEVLKP